MSGISNHYDTMSFIKSVIDGLSLSGLNQCAIQEVSLYQEGIVDILGNPIVLPFVSVAPCEAEKMPPEEGVTNRDAVYYGTLVAIIGNKSSIKLENRLGWRQSIRRNLNNRPIPTLPMDWNLIVEPRLPVYIGAYFDRSLFVSGMIVWSKFQEPRQ